VASRTGDDGVEKKKTKMKFFFLETAVVAIRQASLQPHISKHSDEKIIYILSKIIFYKLFVILKIFFRFKSDNFKVC